MVKKKMDSINNQTYIKSSKCKTDAHKYFEKALQLVVQELESDDTGSQWRLNKTGVIWADRLVWVNILAAEFWMYYKREIECAGNPAKKSITVVDVQCNKSML